MSKPNKEIEFNFLPEKPLSDSEQALFGHKEIVSTLKRIIKNSPKNNSLTFGLFGDWGSGKSTIVESLQKELSKKKEGPIPVVIFDVWKHEGDALRRSFLRHLESQLKDKGIFGEKYLSSKFEYPYDNLDKKSSIISEKSKFNWRRFLSIIGLTYFSAFLLGILGWVIVDKWLGIYDIRIDNIETVLTILLAILPFSFAIEKSMNNSIIKETEIKEKDKFKEPSQFLEAFKYLLEELKKTKKLIIVFDNLDRVKGEKATNILSTIKTFLEPVDKDVDKTDIIFIIPCDDKQLKKHIGEESAEEYLRKIFNTSLRIPSFNPTELEKYAWNLLNETKIEHLKDPKISSIITQVFRDNPRQIIQFINTLITYYLILWEREKNGELGVSNFLDKNIPQLAKFLLLEQKFPSMMNYLRSNYIYDLNNLNQKIGTHNEENTRLFYHFDIFLKSTYNIKIESLEIFFKLRSTEHEKKLPNSGRLIKLMDSELLYPFLMKKIPKDNESFIEKKEFIDSLKLKEKEKEFSTIIYDKLEEKKLNLYQLNFFLNNLFTLSNKYSVNLDIEVFERIESIYNQSNVIEYFELIRPSLLFDEFIIKYKSLSSSNLSKIINEWIEIFSSQTAENDKREIPDDYLNEIVDLLIHYSGRINETNENKIIPTFKKLYIPEKSEKLEKVLRKKGAYKIFINDEGIRTFIRSLEYHDFLKSPQKIEVYELLDQSEIHTGIFYEFLLKINELLEPKIGDSSSYNDSTFNSLLDFAINNIDRFNRDKVNFSNDELNTALRANYNIFRLSDRIDWKTRKKIILYLKKFEKLNTQLKADIKDFIASFFNQASIDDIESILNKIDDSDTLITDTRLFNHKIEQRFYKDYDFLKVIYTYSNDKLKSTLLIRIIDHRKYKFFWDIVEHNDFVIPNSQLIAERILEETKKGLTSSINLEHQIKFYEILEKFDIELNDIDKEKYYEQLDHLIRGNRHDVFENGLRVFIYSQFFEEEFKKKKIGLILKHKVGNIQNNMNDIKAIFNESRDSFGKSFIDDLYELNKEKFETNIFGELNVGLLDTLLNLMSDEFQFQLINNLLVTININIKADIPNRKPAIKFLEIFKIITRHIELHDFYMGIKDNLMIIFSTLLEPNRNSQLHEFVISKLKTIKKNSRGIPKDLQGPIDEFYFSTIPTLDHRKKIEQYLSTEAEKNKLIFLEAIYGEGDHTIDITDKLNSEVKASTIEVNISNQLAGKDPLEGVKKKLKFKYRYKGEVQEKELPENAVLKLP